MSWFNAVTENTFEFLFVNYSGFGYELYGACERCLLSLNTRQRQEEGVTLQIMDVKKIELVLDFTLNIYWRISFKRSSFKIVKRSLYMSTDQLLIFSSIYWRCITTSMPMMQLSWHVATILPVILQCYLIISMLTKCFPSHLSRFFFFLSRQRSNKSLCHRIEQCRSWDCRWNIDWSSGEKEEQKEEQRSIQFLYIREIDKFRRRRISKSKIKQSVNRCLVYSWQKER